MQNRLLTRKNLIIATVAIMFLVCLNTSPTRAQGVKASPPKPADEEKAVQIMKQAVEALGSNNYLEIRSLTARGLYTQYKDGQIALPLTFVDYILFPDKERTEFRGEGIKSIQTNTGETGWTFDGMTKVIKPMKPKQIAEFKLARRVSVESLLRGTWREDGASIAYAGRREAGVAKRNEAVRVSYPDGFKVEFEFGSQDHLPAKVLYVTMNSETGVEIKEEDRMQKYLEMNGIVAPYVVDHYRDNVQTSRINYDSIEYNVALSDSLFAQPANAKAIK